MNKKNITAVIYARVSTPDQEKEGFSIPAQLKFLKSYAEKKGFSVIHEFIDIESAKSSGREKFTEMLKFIKKEERNGKNQNCCRIILAEKTDRLYRNFNDYVCLDPQSMGIEIHLVNENLVLSQTSGSMEKFVHGLNVLLAKRYIDNLSEETKKGMREKAEQGLYPSQAPLGYLNVGNNGKRIIIPDPIIAPLIKKMFEWYDTGHYSLESITIKIQKEGLNYRKAGKKIQKSVIHKILKNPIYYGSFLWNGKLYIGIHKPLITKELFDNVQKMMFEKGNRRTRQQKHLWPFQGLLTCGHCGCALTAEIQKGRYIYYHCTGNKGQCPEKKFVREEEVSRQFGLAIECIELDREVANWIVSALKQNHYEEKKFHDAAISRLQREHVKYQNRIDGIYLDKLDGVIMDDFYNQKSKDWREKQENILMKIKDLQQSNQSHFENSIQLIDLTQTAERLYNQQSMTEKRKLINFVFSKSIWKDGTLYPSFRKPFDIILGIKGGYKKKHFVFNDGNSLYETFSLPDLKKQIPPNPVKSKKTKRPIRKTKKISNPVRDGFLYIQFLEENPHATYADLASAKGITKARISQMIAVCRRLPKEITEFLIETDDPSILAYFTERRLRPLTRMNSDIEKIEKFNQMKNAL